jgi:tRNA G10  N-methylase Trm11
MYKQYFYTIRYTVKEESLCKMEMKYLFHKKVENNFFFSDFYVDPIRSVFVKQCISVIYTGSTLENIVEQILANNLSYDKFKVKYLNLDEDIPYEERRKIEYIVGYDINGFADVHNPKTLLGITKVNDIWIFGELMENKEKWKVHSHQPYNYSNALGVRTARSIVNIASANNMNIRLIDPCCGIGTVVMEALSLGLDIKGVELNPLIADNAKRNLEFFGYKDVILNDSMHNILENFDYAIVDMPYGLFNPTTLEEQLDIIKTTRRIADKAIFITYVNMEHYFIDYGFTIKDSCDISKGTFKRYITLCE